MKMGEFLRVTRFPAGDEAIVNIERISSVRTKDEAGGRTKSVVIEMDGGPSYTVSESYEYLARFLKANPPI
jgi:hypothetical protein